MSSHTSSTLVSLANINSEVETMLRRYKKIANNQNVSAFKINFEQMKDGLIPVDWTISNEPEVITIDLNG